MAASVLGKRSRRALEQDGAPLLPPRKRTGRLSTPRIFEDASESCDVLQSSAQKDPPRKGRSSGTRTVSTKQHRQNNTVTRKVDTHQTAESVFQDENVHPAFTPSTNEFKDALNLPNTPKHRVRLAGGLLTPRTPSTTASPKQRPHSVFAVARQLFSQASSPAKLVGRHAEKQQLDDFISGAITTKVGGCTYVSGPPGTGKSALVQEVLQNYKNDNRVRLSSINCVTLKTSPDVYAKLLEDFDENSTVGKASARTHLAKMLTGKRRSMMHLVMLDEIDSLVDADCEVLYTLFEWSMNASSSLILIGIANALDLTDRFLPRLKARGLKPKLLPFLPYTAQQISTIITEKLQSLLAVESTAPQGFVPLMHPAAIQLCGKKVASQTGDLRKAFNLVKRSIDQVEKETLGKQATFSPSKKPLGEVTNAARQVLCVEETTDVLNPETAPRVTIAHVARLASSIFNNGTLSRLSGLNLQQKAVLCSLVNKEIRKHHRDPFSTPSKSVNKIPTIKDLYATYSTLCKRDDGLLHPLKDTEFRDVVASLETLGLIHEYKARISSLLSPSNTPSRAARNSDEKQFVSAVSEKEMRDSLNGGGADLLRRLLDE